MKLKSIILSTIAIANTSCFQKCPNGETPLNLDQEVTADELLSYIDSEDMTLDEIDCEALCVSIADDGWRYGHTIDACELALTIEELPADASDESIGTITCTGSFEVCMGGRRPMGHHDIQMTNPSLGAYFANCAHMEAASVVAFIQLSNQLQELHAPQQFIQRCKEAAKDEVLHAKLLCRLANEEGFEIPPLQRSKTKADLFTIALHNAVEGCVNENWAALLAQWQALHAPSAELRAVYAKIASDEAKHGQLAWDLHKWLLSKLTVEQQQIIQLEQTQAIKNLIKSGQNFSRKSICE